jgi:uncharacterized protein YndB with AHSA1/START domain
VRRQRREAKRKMATNKTEPGPRMSDDAVKAKTGKTWKQWFAILDKAGAHKMNHQEIVKYLSTKQGVGPWWQQMVTVTYEQARGLRERHQKPEGYQVSVSRIIKTPLAKLFKSVANEKARKAWLPENGLTIRKATPNKSIRITWNDGKSSLEINFYSKGNDKSQVVIQHSKLPDAKASAKMKDYWSKALDRMRASLEKLLLPDEPEPQLSLTSGSLKTINGRLKY